MARFILDKEKYKAAFLYITNKLGEIEGMKKAYKLFYFLDFDFFEAYERPFTGEIYKSLPMGPAPIYFEGVVDELVKEKKIKKDSLRVYPNHEHDTVVYKPLTDTNYKFTTEEKKMLDRIIKLYGSQTGKSLEKLSHAEAPYNAVDLYQVIPYEYSFYRDTPNLTDQIGMESLSRCCFVNHPHFLKELEEFIAHHGGLTTVSPEETLGNIEKLLTKHFYDKVPMFTGKHMGQAQGFKGFPVYWLHLVIPNCNLILGDNFGWDLVKLVKMGNEKHGI